MSEVMRHSMFKALVGCLAVLGSAAAAPLDTSLQHREWMRKFASTDVDQPSSVPPVQVQATPQCPAYGLRFSCLPFEGWRLGNC